MGGDGRFCENLRVESCWKDSGEEGANRGLVW